MDFRRPCLSLCSPKQNVNNTRCPGEWLKLNTSPLSVCLAPDPLWRHVVPLKLWKGSGHLIFHLLCCSHATRSYTPLSVCTCTCNEKHLLWHRCVYAAQVSGCLQSSRHCAQRLEWRSVLKVSVLGDMTVIRSQWESSSLNINPARLTGVLPRATPCMEQCRGEKKVFFCSPGGNLMSCFV